MVLVVVVVEVGQGLEGRTRNPLELASRAAAPMRTRTKFKTDCR